MFCLVLFPNLVAAQQWTFASRTDPVEGSRIATASVSSTRGSSFVRCKDGRLETFFAPWFTYIGQETANVRYRFSGGRVQSVTWSVSTNGTAVFADEPVYFARELARASSLAMDVYDFNGTPNRVSIPLSGSRVAITRVFTVCGLPIVDPSNANPEIDFRVVDAIDSLTIEAARDLGVQLEVNSRAVRPVELYEKLNDTYNFVGLKGCLDEKSPVFAYGYCVAWRDARKSDPEAFFQLDPFEAIVAWSEAKSPKVTVAPVCTEAPTQARKLRPFNVERAWPQSAIDAKIEGTVSATLQISDSGDVVGVVITSENPPGVFGSAVEREARRMKYSPARRDCSNVSDSVPMTVQFMLAE
jgi:TonB family protein